jgi:Bystin
MGLVRERGGCQYYGIRVCWSLRRGEQHSTHCLLLHFTEESLSFYPRYKQDLTPDQKTALLDLLRVQKHEGIGPEIRRELTTGEARGEMLEEPIGYGEAGYGSDYDDAMSV